MLQIIYWSDYNCPYCYIGETNLKAAIDELNITDYKLEMKAFELDPTASCEYTGTTLERFSKKYHISLEEAEKQIEKISNMGRNSGIDFNYATTRFTNSMDAHRLTKFVQKNYDEKTTNTFINELFKTYFTDNLELANHEVLLEVVKKLKLDVENARKVLKSDEYLKEVRQDEQMAALFNIHGVPNFIINGVQINGCMSKDDFVKLLKSFSSKTEELTGQACDLSGNCH